MSSQSSIIVMDDFDCKWLGHAAGIYYSNI